MAVEIVWLDQAKDDLREILDFIANENPTAAANYVAGIAEACKKLADFPEFGLRYNSKFRRLVFRNHLVFYHHDETAHTVFIASVIDGRRDLKGLFPDEN
jgi:plasmid stabilization system protein ParE